MIRLWTLGLLDLQGADAAPISALLSQPKRLALLAYLAAASPHGFHRRDKLLALFWPEADQEHARAALRKSIHVLRRALGEGALLFRGDEELATSPEAVWCDASSFEEAVSAERWADALELYRGDLLEGFFVPSAPELEQWLERERARLRKLAERVALALAGQHDADGNVTGAVSAARRAVELGTDDERTVQRLIALLDRLGDRAGALHTFDRLARHLATEYHAEPSPETRALIERIRARALSPPVLVASTPASPSGLPDVPGYQIERELARGGMAIVYVARDLKHGRSVAVKVFQAECAVLLGKERFLREIQIAAQLAHPHILPLLDSGAANGLLYYVMPLVRGESLRARLQRDGPFDVEEAIRLIREVADALDCAHRRGIVHRDVKPENILLQEGHAVVADFGVARAMTSSMLSGPSEAVPISTVRLAIGSRCYMSPEQADGRDVDARTDIYALGCVLYELLAGDPPVASNGSGVTRTRISRAEVSAALLAVIEKAMAPRPADRFASVADLARAVSRESTERRTTLLSRLPPAIRLRPLSWTAPARRFTRTRSAVYGALAVLGAFLAGMLVERAQRTSSTRAALSTDPVRQFSILLPDSSPFSPTSDEFFAPKQGIAITPDGSVVAYTGRRGTSTLLHLIRLGDGSVTPLAGTAGARLPAFSPDGLWLAFVAEGEIRKVQVDGGTVVRLSPVEAPTGLFWMSNAQLLASRSVLGPGTVPSSGGRLERLGARFRSYGFIHTQLLPGGAYLLGTTAYGELATIALESGDIRFITIGSPEEQDRAEFGHAIRGRNPHYLRSGHLVYASGSSLVSVPFDSRTLRTTGRPTPVAPGIRMEAGPGEAHFAISDEETLVFAPGADPSSGALVWVDQRGTITDTLLARAGNLLGFSLSRDGRRLAAVERMPNTPAETRIVDLARRVEARARLEGEFAVWSWTADGRALIGTYVADTARSRACCFTAAELDVGTLSLRPMAVPLHAISEGSEWRIDTEVDESPDGTLRCSDAAADLYEAVLLRHADNSVPPRMVATGKFGDCRFSPDGRWIAYTGNGLFVTRATLDTSARTFKLLPGASGQARWTADGRAILYGDGRGLFTTGIRAKGDTVEASEPRLLFQRDNLLTTWSTTWATGWDLARDGRILVWQGPAHPPAGYLKVVTGLGALAAQKSGVRGERE